MMTPVADTVRKDLMQAIDQDALVLPTLPEIAVRVRELSENPDTDIPVLVDLIGNDAALSARIIQVANSPLIRANQRINDLQTALTRLGIEYACNLATGLAMQQMFQATSDLIDSRLRQAWARSTEVAGISHVLCQHYTNLRPDQAMLAGLVHQIGVLPILTYAEDHPSLLIDSLTLDQVIDELYGVIGDRILQAWKFPTDIARVPSEHRNFSREIEHADYIDITTVALLQSHMGDDTALGKLDWHQVKAFERLGIEPDRQLAEGQDLSEEMQAAMGLLREA